MNDLYYKLIRSNKNEEWLTVVCMQWFDENDYEQSRFLRAKGTDDILRFDDEKDAIKFLNDNIKIENIDPEFRFHTQSSNDALYKD